MIHDGIGFLSPEGVRGGGDMSMLSDRESAKEEFGVLAALCKREKQAYTDN